MNEVNNRIVNKWWELVFYLSLSGLGMLLFFTGMYTEIDEDGLLNARTLPLLLSGIVVLYATSQSVKLFRATRKHAFPALNRDDLLFRIILPLSLIMVLYVHLVQALGYPVGTTISMIAVLWVFGVRGIILNPLLAIFSAIISNTIFVTMLHTYMPEGWALEWFTEALNL